jgi:hypothetical protein
MVAGHQRIEQKILGWLHGRSFQDGDARSKPHLTNDRNPNWFAAAWPARRDLLKPVDCCARLERQSLSK